MKTKLLIAALLALLLPSVFAHEAKVAGPNGGRILDKIEPHVEFLVTPERKVRLTFLDAANKPIAATTQTATVITGDRSKPATLKFEKSGDVLVSDQALPAGDDLPAVVMIQATPEAKTQTAKFNINFATCPDCKRLEYACTCGH